MPRIPLILVLPLFAFSPLSTFAQSDPASLSVKTASEPDIVELKTTLMIRGKRIIAVSRTQEAIPDEVLLRFGLHRLHAGETLGKISRMVGVSQDNILAMNPSMNPNSLMVGQVIRIRASTTQDAAVEKSDDLETRMLRKGMPRAEVSKRLAAAGVTPTMLEWASPGSGASPDFWALPNRADTLILSYDGEGGLSSISVQCDSHMPKDYRHGYVTDVYLLPPKSAR